MVLPWYVRKPLNKLRLPYVNRKLSRISWSVRPHVAASEIRIFKIQIVGNLVRTPPGMVKEDFTKKWRCRSLVILYIHVLRLQVAFCCKINERLFAVSYLHTENSIFEYFISVRIVLLKFVYLIYFILFKKVGMLGLRWTLCT